MFKNYFIISILIFLVSCSDSAYFDPGPCPRAAILKGSETKEIDRSDLVIELNRTIMICEYNLRRKNINFDVGICLLYTSPSPRDISGSRMPSSA